MAEDVLVVRRLCKKYGAALVADHIDLRIERGQIYGLVGKNGAGKTTLLRMITAQTRPLSGEIELFGATGKALDRMRSRIGAIVETPSFYPFLTAYQNLEYYRRQRGLALKRCVEDTLQAVGLAETKSKKYKDFSLGMKQRLGLGLAIMGRPDLLLLDEPVNGLDPMGIIQLRNILLRLNAEQNVTILISSHILSELANLATHYGFMDKGRMIQQVSAQEISARCQECLELEVDDVNRAAVALERQLGCKDYEIFPENRIWVYAFQRDPVRVTKALTDGGVAITAIHTHGTDLEGYYTGLLARTDAEGGEGNAQCGQGRMV